MKVERLCALINTYGEQITEYYFCRTPRGYSRLKYQNIVLEAGSQIYDDKYYLHIYTKKPDGNKFMIYDYCKPHILTPNLQEITIPHGAWCYSIWKAFQYLEDLDYFTNEAKERKIQEERDKVHNWFLANRQASQVENRE